MPAPARARSALVLLGGTCLLLAGCQPPDCETVPLWQALLMGLPGPVFFIAALAAGLSASTARIYAPEPEIRWAGVALAALTPALSVFLVDVGVTSFGLMVLAWVAMHVLALVLLVPKKTWSDASRWPAVHVLSVVGYSLVAFVAALGAVILVALFDQKCI